VGNDDAMSRGAHQREDRALGSIARLTGVASCLARIERCGLGVGSHP
jgi:hypothetical protein